MCVLLLGVGGDCYYREGLGVGKKAGNMGIELFFDIVCVFCAPPPINCADLFVARRN